MIRYLNTGPSGKRYSSVSVCKSSSHGAPRVAFQVEGDAKDFMLDPQQAAHLAKQLKAFADENACNTEVVIEGCSL
jgi:hypothetical protein